MRFVCVFLLSIALTGVTKAQYSDNYFDVGLFGGVSTYTGDLAPAPFAPKHLHLSVGAFGRYNIGKWVSARLAFNYGRISGNDADSRKDERKNRNLSFRNDIFELGVTGEWNLLGYHPRAMEKPFSPYLFAGIAGFYHSPKAREAQSGTWVGLQGLGTEGQLAGGGYLGRKPYKKIGLAVPLGIGVKVAVNSRWTIGVEVGFRKTFTDYIDDVSLTYADSTFFINTYGANSLNQTMADRSGEVVTDPNFSQSLMRGDEKDYDWYVLLGVTVSYNFLDEGLVGSSKRGRRKPGCRGANF